MNKMDGLIVFSTPQEAVSSVKQAGEQNRGELKDFADLLEREEPTIAERVALATSWLHEIRPDIRFGVVSEFGSERWVVHLFLPEEDRMVFLDQYSDTLHRYGGNGLVFDVNARGEYDPTILDPVSANS